MILRLAIVLLLALAPLRVVGQADTAAPKVQLKGMVGAEVMVYRYGPFSTVRDPFVVRFYGTPTLIIGDWTVPAYFNIGDYQRQYRQHFSKLGISPQYKDWLTLHLGHRTMQFSQLTLGGHNFLGGGAEIQKGKLRLGAVGGQFLRPVTPDSLLQEVVMPAYRRVGAAVKVGHGTRDKFIDLVWFTARDLEGSVDIAPQQMGMAPAANSAVGIVARKTLLEGLHLNLDAAISAYNGDVREEQVRRPNVPEAIVMVPFNRHTLATRYAGAVQADLEYRKPGYSARLFYDRIGSEYRTMGEYFFRNDIERIRASGRVEWKKYHLQFTPSVGIERTGLNQMKAIQNRRLISGMRAVYRPGRQLMVAGHYQNFQTRLRQVQFVPNDSVLFTQVNRSMGLFGTYRMGERFDRGLTLAINHTGGATRQPGVDTAVVQARQWMANAAWQQPLAETGYFLTAGLLVNRTDFNFFTVTRWQPYVQGRKAWLEGKLQAQYNLAIILARVSGSAANLGWRNILSAQIRTWKQHQLTARIAWLYNNPTGFGSSYTEWQGQVGYRVNF